MIVLFRLKPLAHIFREFQINQAAKIVLTVRDESKDKNYLLEMGYVGTETDGKFRQLSAEQVCYCGC